MEHHQFLPLIDQIGLTYKYSGEGGPGRVLLGLGYRV